MTRKILRLSLLSSLFVLVLAAKGIPLYPHPTQGFVGGEEVFQRIEAPVRERLIELERRELYRVKNTKERLQFNISQGATFDDNLFLDHGGKATSDLKLNTDITLGLVLLRPRTEEGGRGLGLGVLGLGGLIVGYRMNREVYTKYSRLNSTNHYLTLDSGLAPRLFGKKLKLAVSARQTPEVFLLNNPGSAKGEKRKRTQYVLSTKATYPWSEKTEAGVQYSAEAFRYDEKSKKLDSLTQSWEPSLSYRWRPKTAFAGSGRVALTEYQEKENNSVGLSAKFMVMKILGFRTSLGLGLGYAMIQKEEAGSESKSFTFNALLAHVFNQRARLGIFARRQLQESLLVSAQEGTAAFSTRQLEEAVRDENPTVITHTVGASLDYRLTPRLSLSSSVAANYDEDSATRHNRFLVQVQSALKYVLSPSWTCESGYTFTALNSNQNSSDYKDNLLFMRLGYTFGGQGGGKVQSRGQEL